MSKLTTILFIICAVFCTISTYAQVNDHDGDLIVDSLDIDDDNDGVPDNTEKYPNCEVSNVFNWVNWISINDKIAIGEITVPGKTINVTVTHSVGGMFSTSGVFAGGTFPINYNVPINNITLANSQAGVLSVTFSEPVSNPLFAFSSIGNPGIDVPVITSVPYTIVWQGQGITYNTATQFTGREGYNIVQLPQVRSNFSFDYQVSESYCNIVFGAKDIVNCSGSIADTDKDGIPNYLDLDSDGDGCSDAFESGATINKVSNFSFSGPVGQNGLADLLEKSSDDGIINYISTYNQIALNKLQGKCVFVDTDGDGIEDDDDIDDDNDGVLDTDEGKCTNNFAGFVPTTFDVFKYDLGIPDYTTPTNKLNPSKLVLVGLYSPPIPGKIDWRLSDASMHIGLNIPFNQYQYKNGYTSEPNVNITIFRVIVPKGFKNVVQSITRFGVDGGTNIWKNGVMIDGMCCGDEGGPSAPITTTYTVNSGDTIEFRSVNGRPVHQSTNFEFTKIIGKCIVPDDFDTDGDGIVNRLDTDSDGDGCSDAFESGATLSKTPSNYVFKGPFGANGYKDSLETALESGTINYKLTYNQAIDSTYAFCDCPFGVGGFFAKDTLSFCGSASIDAGSGYKYKWKDGSTSQILVTNQTAKTYVNIGKPGCHYSDTLFVHVLSSGIKPRDTTLCDGNDLTLKVDLNSLNTYPTLLPSVSWSPNVKTNNILIKPKADTIVYCLLKNKLLSCKDSILIHVVKGKTKINQLNELICATDSVILKADTAKTYLWSTTQKSRSIKIPANTKSISLSVLDTVGCPAKDTMYFDFQLQPLQWNANQVNVTCFQAKDGVINLNPSGGIKPYSFNWSDGTSNNMLRNLDKGIVNVSLIDSNGCKKDTTFTITEPSAALSISGLKKDIQCVGDSSGSIDLTVIGGTIPFLFNWDSGQKTEDISQLKSGIYTVIVSDKNDCIATYKDTIKALHVLPKINAGNDTSICLRDSVLLQAKGGLVYVWSPFGTNLKYVKPKVGLNSLIVVGEDVNACKAYDTLIINVLDLPIVKAGVDTSLCEGANLKLLAKGNAISYEWNKNIINNQIFTPKLGAETYILKGTDLQNCVNTDTIIVTVYPYPKINLTISDTIGCSPLNTTINYHSQVELTTFKWIIDGLEFDSINNQIQKEFLKAGCYSIAFQANYNGCKTMLSKNNAVCVLDLPQADFKVDTTIVTIKTPTVKFTNLSENAELYRWNFDDDSSSNSKNISHTFPPKVNDFIVKLLAYKPFKNCIDSHSIVIHVRDDLILYCPNAFTPNRDKLNEVFKPILTTGVALESYTFTIFNRWGDSIFETQDSEQGWDGTFNGNMLAPDIYTYVIWFKDINDGKEHRINGHVNLLR